MWYDLIPLGIMSKIVIYLYSFKSRTMTMFHYYINYLLLKTIVVNDLLMCDLCMKDKILTMQRSELCNIYFVILFHCAAVFLSFAIKKYSVLLDTMHNGGVNYSHLYFGWKKEILILVSYLLLMIYWNLTMKLYL